MNSPYFVSDNKNLERAARIATSDIYGNCVPFKDGLLNERKTCIMAGLDYDTPWTRDTAINTFNCLAIDEPNIALNTLLSVCEEKNGKKYIGGQYWDSVIWALGAWQYYLINKDNDLLNLAFETISNSLERFEEEEQDPTDGLFRGAAVYGDGVSAYPDHYAKNQSHSDAIFDWIIGVNDERKPNKGFGLPMKVLSTNCVYYLAYKLAGQICDILKQDSSTFFKKAEVLKTTINNLFWNDKKETYNYLIDYKGVCDYQEALGISFAILFGVADEEKTKKILKNTYISPNGIPCVYPSFDRYVFGNNFGRHSGTIWPHAQGFWALAAIKSYDYKAFEFELFNMAEKAIRDNHFAEIYHPSTGQIYGGMQESKNGVVLTYACVKQTWSATAFRSMIYYGLFGMDFLENEVIFKPYLPHNTNTIKLEGISLFGKTLTVEINRKDVLDNTKMNITISDNSDNIYLKREITLGEKVSLKL